MIACACAVQLRSARARIQLWTNSRVATYVSRAQSTLAMHRRILQWLLTLTLLLNAAGAPWAMAAMSHSMGHAMSHQEHAAPAEGAMKAHDHHGMHHPQMAAASQPADETNSKPAGACCNGTTCHCGCVLPPALLFVVVPQVPQRVALMPSASAVERSSALPSTPPFRPPSV